MTYFDVIAQILSEASGKPLGETRRILIEAIERMGVPGKINDPIPDEKARELLHDLRSELPRIRRWLAEGRLAEILQRMTN